MSKNQLKNTSCKSVRQATLPGLIHRLLPATSRVAGTVFASALLWLGPSSGYADQVFNDFQTGYGTWTTQVGITAPGFNMGWFNSGNASGVAGEVGGLVTRTNTGTSALMPRILDIQSFVGQPMNLNYNINVTGKMYLQNVAGANSDLNFGYFDSSSNGGSNATDVRLVMRIHSPSGGNWRFRLAAGQASTSRVTVTGTESVPLDFNFSFVPGGANNGAGTLSGYVGTYYLGALSVAANTFNFDSFGMWVDSASGTDLNAKQNMFFDNVSFTIVPEPATAVLLPLGVGLLLLTRRTLRRN